MKPNVWQRCWIWINNPKPSDFSILWIAFLLCFPVFMMVSNLFTDDPEQEPQANKYAYSSKQPSDAHLADFCYQLKVANFTFEGTASWDRKTHAPKEDVITSIYKIESVPAGQFTYYSKKQPQYVDGYDAFEDIVEGPIRFGTVSFKISEVSGLLSFPNDSDFNMYNHWEKFKKDLSKWRDPSWRLVPTEMKPPE